MILLQAYTMCLLLNLRTSPSDRRGKTLFSSDLICLVICNSEKGPKRPNKGWYISSIFFRYKYWWKGGRGKCYFSFKRKIAILCVWRANKWFNKDFWQNLFVLKVGIFLLFFLYTWKWITEAQTPAKSMCIQLLGASSPGECRTSWKKDLQEV